MDRANNSIDNIKKLTGNMTESMQEKNRENNYYQKKDSDHLHAIQRNTDSLHDIVNLLQQNNEKQDEIKELIFELLAIAALKSESEIKSSYDEWRIKVTNLGMAVTAVTTLSATGEKLMSFLNVS